MSIRQNRVNRICEMLNNTNAHPLDGRFDDMLIDIEQMITRYERRA